MKNVDLAIIGGGIAGLATAVACNRAGHTAHVFEAAPEFHPLGTSLSLWPNAMKCLSDWGLDKQVAECGAIIGQIAWRRPDGRAYFEQPLNTLYEAIGHQGVCVRRSDFHKNLVEVIPPNLLHTEHSLIDFEDINGRVGLTFANGVKMSAKHVVAADGIRSEIRAKILNDGAPKYAGYGAWLGLSLAPSPNDNPSEGCEYLGPNGRLGIFETGNDTRYWFFIANQKAQTKHAVSADLAEVIELINQWPLPFRELVASSTPNGVTKVSFYDRAVSSRWGKGNITLIGDAIHPFLPNLGQGACQSIEDAHVFAEGLTAGKSGPELTQWMESTRNKRVREMQNTSKRVGLLAQKEDMVSHMMRKALGLFKGTMKRQLKSQFLFPRNY